MDCETYMSLFILNLNHSDEKELINCIENADNVNKFKNPNNVNILMIAINRSHFNIIKALIKNGMNVNNTDNSIESPLIWAAYTLNLDIIDYLILHGAKLNYNFFEFLFKNASDFKNIITHLINNYKKDYERYLRYKNMDKFNI